MRPVVLIALLFYGQCIVGQDVLSTISGCAATGDCSYLIFDENQNTSPWTSPSSTATGTFRNNGQGVNSNSWAQITMQNANTGLWAFNYSRAGTTTFTLGRLNYLNFYIAPITGQSTAAEYPNIQFGVSYQGTTLGSTTVDKLLTTNITGPWTQCAFSFDTYVTGFTNSTVFDSIFWKRIDPFTGTITFGFDVIKFVTLPPPPPTTSAPPTSLQTSNSIGTSTPVPTSSPLSSQNGQSSQPVTGLNTTDGAGNLVGGVSKGTGINVPLVVGVVVGIGAFLILLAIIVIGLILYITRVKKQNLRQTFFKGYEKPAGLQTPPISPSYSQTPPFHPSVYTAPAPQTVPFPNSNYATTFSSRKGTQDPLPSYPPSNQPLPNNTYQPVLSNQLLPNNPRNPSNQSLPNNLRNPSNQSLPNNLRTPSNQSLPNNPRNPSNQSLPPARNLTSRGRSVEEVPMVAMNSARSSTDINKWEIPFEELQFGKEIGAGGFGQVFMGTWRMSSVAIKVIPGVMGTEAIAAFRQEADIMMSLRPHKNVVQLLGICSVKTYCIVLEYLEGGSLAEYVQLYVNIPLIEKLAFIRGIAAGLHHLAKERIVHRDIAARNILLDVQKTPKVSDFGMSRVIDLQAEGGHTKAVIGPVRWMAPESLKTKQYSEKSDVWAFGITAWEVLAQDLPHEGLDQLDVALRIRDTGLTPKIPSGVPAWLIKLLQSCWNVNPQARPTFAEIVTILANNPS